MAEILESYYSEAEAQLAKNILEEKGIKSAALGGDALKTAGLEGDIKLMVAKEDLRRARKILEESRHPIIQKIEENPAIKRAGGWVKKWLLFILIFSIAVSLLEIIYLNLSGLL